MEETSYSFDYSNDLFDQDMVPNIVDSPSQVAYSLDLVADLDTERKLLIIISDTRYKVSIYIYKKNISETI